MHWQCLKYGLTIERHFWLLYAASNRRATFAKHRGTYYVRANSCPKMLPRRFANVVARAFPTRQILDFLIPEDPQIPDLYSRECSFGFRFGASNSLDSRFSLYRFRFQFRGPCFLFSFILDFRSGSIWWWGVWNEECYAQCTLANIFCLWAFIAWGCNFVQDFFVCSHWSQTLKK